jgi:hypothetical protein
VLRYSIRENIPPRRYARHVALFSSIYEPSSCLEEETFDTLMEDDVEIDTRIIMDGSIIEYKDRVDGISNRGS